MIRVLIPYFRFEYERSREEGLTDREIYQEWGISESKFYRWKKKYISPSKQT